MKTPAELYEAANRAAADAIRWRQHPNGGAMATLRRKDAAQLRAMARAALRA